MPRQSERGEASGKAVWDTGSSLYDSYELAAVRRLIDRRLLAGARPVTDEPPPAPAERERDESKQQIVVVSGARRAGRKKVTLRALFRAVVSWAIRLKPKPSTCVVLPQGGGGGAVEPVVSPHGLSFQPIQSTMHEAMGPSMIFNCRKCTLITSSFQNH